MLSVRTWLFVAILLTPVFLAARLATPESLPPDLRRAMATVWKLTAKQTEWTNFEIEAYRTRFMRAPNPRYRLRWHSEVAGHRVLVASYYDRFSQNGRGEIYLYLDEPPPPPRALVLQREGLEPSKLDITLNGVRFRPRDRNFPPREVYLKDVSLFGELEDRLRLAVNDNEILNPWHRVKLEPLRKEWGDPKNGYRSPLQQSAIDFLHGVWRSGQLGKGALVQEPTGTGKTETAIGFVDDLKKAGEKFRILWLVDGYDLVDQAETRFRKNLPKMGTNRIWRSREMVGRAERREVMHGAADNIFASLDSLKSDRNQALLRHWIERPDLPPVFLFVDETHLLGAATHKSFYEWLWQSFSGRIYGRVGLSATPIHRLERNVAKFFGDNVHYALLDPKDRDPDTGLPTVSFMQQLNIAAGRGYVALPLLYSLGSEEDEGEAEAVEAENSETGAETKSEPETENLYTEEQMAEIKALLEKFSPAKAIVYHAPGQHRTFGQSARMKQFAKYLEDKGSPALGKSLYVSGETLGVLRTGTLDRFRALTTGILSLTFVGSYGLDIPDANLILLVNESGSVVMIMQRIGRGSRLSPGKAVFRVVDKSGRNLALALNDLTVILSAKGASARREKLRQIIARVADGEKIDDTLLREFYEVFGIDPALVGGDRSTFDALFEYANRTILGSFRWHIDPEAASRQAVTLPAPAEGQTLRQYFAQHTSILEAAELLQPFRKVGSRLLDLFVIEEGEPADRRRRLHGAWNNLFGDLWKSSRPPLVWSVDITKARAAGIALTVRKTSEQFFPYLKRHKSVFEAAELTGSWKVVVPRLTPLFTFEDQSEAQARLRKAWHYLFPDSNPQRRRRLRWKVDRAAARSHVELPAPVIKESFRGYLIRNKPLIEAAGLAKPYSEVGEIVATWFTFDEPDRDPTTVVRRMWHSVFEENWESLRKPVEWHVNEEAAVALGVALSPKTQKETLRAYFVRHEIEFARVGWIHPFLRAKAALNRIFVIDNAKDAGEAEVNLMRNWRKAFRRHWKQKTGRKSQRVAGGKQGTQIAVDLAAAAAAGIALFEPNADETLTAYIERNWEVFRAKGLEKTFREVGDQIAPFFLTEGADQTARTALGAAWGAVYRTHHGNTIAQVDWRVSVAKAKVAGLALTERNPGEGVIPYLRRHEKVVDAAKMMTTFAKVKKKIAPLFIFEGLDAKQALTKMADAWKVAFKHRLLRVKVKRTWSVDHEAATANGLILEAIGPKEPFINYLRRVKPQLQAAKLVKPFNEIGDIVSAIFDLPGETQARKRKLLGMAWFSALSANWLDPSAPKKTRGLDFVVDIARARTAGFTLPPYEKEESFGAYLKRAHDGTPPGERAKLLSLLVNAKDPVITFADSPDAAKFSSRIYSGWNEVSRVAEKNVDAPRTLVEITWPRSPEVAAQISRIEWLHLAVATYYRARLEENPQLHVFFTARDADDFGKVLQAVIGESGPEAADALKRIHRLQVSRKILAGNPANPKQFAAMALEDLYRGIAAQGLDVGLVEKGEIEIFDVGFDGHVMRPLLGALWYKSGLTPVEFFKRVTPRFILSRPEVFHTVPSVAKDPLKNWERRALEIHKAFTRQVGELESKSRKDADAALLQYFRSYGELVIPEFPFVQSLRQAIENKGAKLLDVVDLFEATGSQLLSAPEVFRAWLESYIEGRGLHFEAELATNDLVRRDLGRHHGRVRSLAVDGSVTYERSHSSESAVDRVMAEARQAHLCAVVVAALKQKSVGQ